nr:glycosyltransferase [Kineococcus vitellinus]
MDHDLLAADPPAARVDLPSISVVVPTVVQRVPELERCLASLTTTDHPRYEVILVDNRPERPTLDPLTGLVARFPSVHVVHEPRPGISAARNAGLLAASGEVVAFTDDDVQVDRHWLQALGRRFATHPDEVVVTGLVVPSELETPAQLQYEAHYGGFGGRRTFTPVHVERAPGRGRGQVVARGLDGEMLQVFAVYGIGTYGAGANMAFRRHALVASGGFDPALGTGTPARGGEDLAAMISALWSGGALGYEPAALVHHRHRRDEAGLRRQMLASGIGFTAMLASLVVHDHHHLRTLLTLGPAALRTMARQTVSRMAQDRSAATPGPQPSARRTPAPRSLVALELSGMPLGAFAYVRSRAALARSSSDGRAARRSLLNPSPSRS